MYEGLIAIILLYAVCSVIALIFYLDSRRNIRKTHERIRTNIQESHDRTITNIEESSKRTRANIQKTIADIENSGEETGAKLRELSTRITSGEDNTQSSEQKKVKIG